MHEKQKFLILINHLAENDNFSPQKLLLDLTKQYNDVQSTDLNPS